MRRAQLKKRGRYSNPLLPVLVMLFLTACTPTSKNDPNKDNLAILTYPVDTKITIGTANKSANQTLEDENLLVKVLDDFGATGSNLGERIENLQNANGHATTGLGGIYGHIFLDDAKEHLTGPGNWNSNVSVTEDVIGQITNFYRDEISGAGLFHVTTLVTTTLITPGNPGNPPAIKKVAYHWQVEVDAGGFTIHRNCHKFTDVDCDPVNPNQPFPGTMTLDQNMLQTVIDRNFHYKLWAKGTGIKVIKVYRRNNPGNGIPAPPPSSGNPAPWKLLNEAKYQGLYATTNASCIDMMTIGIPPTNINNLPPVPFYCLGRCESPAIVNSR